MARTLTAGRRGLSIWHGNLAKNGTLMFALIMTPLAPLLVVFKSGDHCHLDAATQHLARELYGQMMKAQQRDSQGFAHWFRGADFALPCALV